MKIALTGHRLEKLGGYEPCPMHVWCRDRIADAFKRLQPTEIISGLALGWDQFGVEVAYALGIPWIAAVPFPGQEQRWPLNAQRAYHMMLERAARVHIVSPAYEKDAFQARNVWMVDQLQDPADVLLAGFNGTSGGTRNCLLYAGLAAKVRGCPLIEVIDPNDFLKLGPT